MFLISLVILDFIMNEDHLPSTSTSSMGTTGTLASDDRILSVKSSISNVGWNEQY